MAAAVFFLDRTGKMAKEVYWRHFVLCYEKRNGVELFKICQFAGNRLWGGNPWGEGSVKVIGEVGLLGWFY